MNTTIIISEIKQDVMKNGKPYWKVFTDQGQMSCFEEPIVVELNKKLGQPQEANVEVSGNFKNIRKLAKGTAQAQTTGTANAPFPVQKMPAQSEGYIAARESKYAEARESKDKSMYTSYAKDIFVAHINAGKEVTMIECINLIKQARDAF